MQRHFDRPAAKPRPEVGTPEARRIALEDWPRLSGDDEDPDDDSE